MCCPDSGGRRLSFHYSNEFLSDFAVMFAQPSLSADVVRVDVEDRLPSAALLLPCQDPELVPDPETVTEKLIEIERINAARAFVDCRQRHADLVTFVKLGQVKGN